MPHASNQAHARPSTVSTTPKPVVLQAPLIQEPPTRPFYAYGFFLMTARVPSLLIETPAGVQLNDLPRAANWPVELKARVVAPPKAPLFASERRPVIDLTPAIFLMFLRALDTRGAAVGFGFGLVGVGLRTGAFFGAGFGLGAAFLTTFLTTFLGAAFFTGFFATGFFTTFFTTFLRPRDSDTAGVGDVAGQTVSRAVT